MTRHARNRGKSAAMETGAEAVRLLDQREQRQRPRHLLFLDADLGDTAAQAGPLIEPVLAGTADMTIAIFTSIVKLGGHGLVVGLSGAGIRRAVGWRPVQPLNGQRCLTRAAFEAARPLARGWGVETGADYRSAAPGPAGLRGPGRDGAPGHRHRPARPAAPRAPARRRGQGARHAPMTGRAAMTRWPGRGGQAGPAAGRAGLIAIGVSVAVTFAVAVAGPSVMEPVLPGRPGQPPWAWAAHLSAYLAVPLTAAALTAGHLGLVLVLHALRGGWSVPARAVLIAGLLAAAVLTLVPPFGSSDQLSYAAYGRMLVTGHNPYTTTPAQLAALGDPVARAVQDWFTTSSVYGPLATGIQGLAALIGGTSARLTVFVLGLANLAAFAGTALLLHRATRPDPDRQLRAALLWAANPLLLQLLIAGAHVDVQAAAFAVAAVVVVFRPGLPGTRRAGLAGVLAGLGFAVKVSDVLVVLGLAIALAVRCWPDWRRLLPPLAGLTAGFAATAGAALAIGGSAMVTQLSRESDMVSIGSPWRVLRTVIHLLVAGTAATDIVKAGAVAVAVVLAVLLIRRGCPGCWWYGLDVRTARNRPTTPGSPVRRAAWRFAGPGLAVRLAVRAALVRRAGLGAAAVGARLRRTPGGAGSRRWGGCCWPGRRR